MVFLDVAAVRAGGGTTEGGRVDGERDDCHAAARHDVLRVFLQKLLGNTAAESATKKNVL